MQNSNKKNSWISVVVINHQPDMTSGFQETKYADQMEWPSLDVRKNTNKLPDNCSFEIFRPVTAF
jgi:hypothetical protein